MSNCAIGTITPQAFLDSYLPQSHPSKRRIRKDIFANIQTNPPYGGAMFARSFVSLLISAQIRSDSHYLTLIGIDYEHKATLSRTQLCFHRLRGC